MRFRAYTRRFVWDVILIGEEAMPHGFMLADPIYPAFDLSGYIRGDLNEDEARTWVSKSDDRWIEWEEVKGVRLNYLLSEVGGRERIERILDEMKQEWLNWHAEKAQMG